LLHRHIREMMPIVYTPVVGLACQRYSHIYRRRRGLILPWPLRDRMDQMLANAPNQEVDIIVVTDGERILGLGDQGAGGMGIPIGKLTLYTLCGGIHPARTLPILLDVGTDNQERLEDPLYFGWRHPRVRGEDYDSFVEAFVQAVIRRFPGVLLQWEDFARDNARRLLDRYRDRLCTFNDDIQGTAAVALAALSAAVRARGQSLRDQRYVFFGAGAAGVGIADLVRAAMVREGLDPDEAASRFWLLGRRGLLHTGLEDSEPWRRPYLQPVEKLADWEVADRSRITLAEVVRHVRPTVLIGTSAQAGAFDRAVVQAMAQHCPRPIIFPLSNPTSKSEAAPQDLLEWTGGRALVATGSPYPPVSWGGRTVHISQCNNSYIFPGLGLGVVASGARRLPDELFMAAAQALSRLSPALSQAEAPLFPPLEEIRTVSLAIARAVALEAQRQGVAPWRSEEETLRAVEERYWLPRYPRIVAAKGGCTHHSHGVPS
ncbi:MAG TPA: NAD-dependent malic enzyme, partial [Candidatus Nitrosotenuis sp.]|nr:NAD-dependent malic enzyme [Candidatus Nitrosotenuis sp.]